MANLYFFIICIFYLYIYIYIYIYIYLYVDLYFMWICGVMMSLYENALQIVCDCNTRGMGKVWLKDSKMLDIYCTFEGVL